MLVENGKYVKKKDEQGNQLPENNWVWSPHGVIAMHQPETWGYVQFVENTTDRFIEKADEQVKWALRQVYYRQHAYFAENKTFTSNSTSLRLHEVMLNNKPFEPEIELIPSGFIASFPSIDKDGVWYIQTDGLIRIIKNQ
jgi:transposase